MFENLNDDNYMLFAAKYYENAHCTDLLEFHDDLKRIRYVKRLFKKYEQTGELKDRLIFNHLIILYNVFDHRAMTRMLCFKLEDQLKYLKPFLIFLTYWRTDFGLIDGKRILDSDIPIAVGITQKLRELDGK